MDISSFLGGQFLTHLDLPQPSGNVWTIRGVQQQMVGTDTKICVQLAEHQKPIGLNKVNLRTIASAYGVNSQAWIGMPLELYRDRTQFQGRIVDCIRLRIPQQAAAAPQPQPVSPPQYQAAPQPAAATPQPVSPPAQPQYQPQPVPAPQPQAAQPAAPAAAPAAPAAIEQPPWGGQ